MKLNLPSAPASPLKGAGYSRETFPWSNDSLGRRLWEMVPSAHRDEVAYRRQKGYFGWTKVVSPEALAELLRVEPTVQAAITQAKEDKKQAQSLERKAATAQRRAHEKQAAHEGGFVSVAAWKRNVKARDEAVQSADRRAFERGKDWQRTTPTAYADLNDYGIAPDRDVIEGGKLTLMNFNRSRFMNVSLVEFMNLSGSKIMRRNAGWRLPAYREPEPPPVPAPTPALPIRLKRRKIAA